MTCFCLNGHCTETTKDVCGVRRTSGGRKRPRYLSFKVSVETLQWNLCGYQGTLVFMEVHTGFNQEMNENRIESVNLANKQESFLCF